MPRQRAPRTDFLTQLRNEMDVAGRPGRAGRDRIGGVARGRGVGSPSAIQSPAVDELDLTGSAQLLVMSATTASIAAGGGFVAFDTIVAQHGFRGVASPSGGYWVHPLDAVYVLGYEHAWDSYQGGGTVRLEVDGILIPEGVVMDGADGQEGRGTIVYVARAGTVGRIKVTHGDGSAQTCDAVVRIGVSDPMMSDLAVGSLDSSVVSLGTQASPDNASWVGYPAGWEDTAAHWIWHAAGSRAAGEEGYFQAAYDSAISRTVDIEVAGDNYCETYLNGVLLGTHGASNGVEADELAGWQTREVYTVSLIAGRNRVAVKGVNGLFATPSSSAAIILSMHDSTSGEVLLRTTDEGGWSTSGATEPDGWPNP